eukprot:gene26596-47956_t
MEKIGRNNPCWCGSGKKYKKCHLTRATEEPHPIGRLIADLHSKISQKKCMHPDAGNEYCSSKIIDAHTIQKKGPLKAIADESSHVFCFGRDANGDDVILRLGWQKASTFKGFCGEHDKKFFSPIEDSTYCGSKEQSYIAGYRAVALEYFKKISVAKGLPFLNQNLDRGMGAYEQFILQSELNVLKQGFFKGIDDLKTTLDIYVGGYETKNYDRFSSLSIYFGGELSVAVSGCFSPDFSMDGSRLQILEPGVGFVENI